MSPFFERVPYDGVSEFHIYTFSHIIPLIISLLLLIGLYYGAPYIKKLKSERIIRYSIGIIMLLSNVSIYIYAHNNQLMWYEYLPEATCGWAIYFGGFALLTKNRTLAILTFFWGWGAISTFLAPNLMEGPMRYNYYQFFLRHLLILATSIYMFRVLDVKVYKRDFAIYVLYTLPMAIIGGVVSFVVDKPDELNMFYMLQPAKNTPIFGAILDIGYPVYVILWLAFAIGIAYVYGIPFYQKEEVKDYD